jgi:NitT/TauT family transport system substrate-binding protein
MLLTVIPNAVAAEDKLILAVAHYGEWESAAAILGQQAGIFKKHGLALRFLPTRDSKETEQLVLSGKADVGTGVNVMEVMHSYAFGAPLRVIGAQMAGSVNYWYVQRSSPIKSFKNIDDNTIAYEANGASSHYDAIDFIREHDLKAKLVLTGSANATFDHVKAGIVDIGWGAPPFGIDNIARGDIRVVARANDVPSIRSKTTIVMITNEEILRKRTDALARFLLAYREAVEWMYSNPAALQRYAELADVSKGVARELRDEFFPEEMLLPDNIIGLNATVKDAIGLRYLQKKLSRRQIRNLVPVAPPTLVERVLCMFISAECPMELIAP